MNPDCAVDLTDGEANCILQAADIVTLARTGVEIDYRGDIIDAHMPEMPTRFAKQLTQIMRGALAVGMSRQVAWRLSSGAPEIQCHRCGWLSLRILRRIPAPASSTSGVGCSARELRLIARSRPCMCSGC